MWQVEALAEWHHEEYDFGPESHGPEATQVLQVLVRGGHVPGLAEPGRERRGETV
jgi:hypothetical protein